MLLENIFATGANIHSSFINFSKVSDLDNKFYRETSNNNRFCLCAHVFRQARHDPLLLL